MSKMFGGAPKQDDSLMRAQQAEMERQRKENEKQRAEADARTAKEKEAQDDLKRRQRMGRKSLLGETDELGVS